MSDPSSPAAGQFIPNYGRGGDQIRSKATTVRDTDVVRDVRPLHDDIMRSEVQKYNASSPHAPLSHGALPVTGLSHHIRNQEPSASIVPHHERADMKDSLAQSNAVKRPQDFPALQPVRVTGKAKCYKPADTPLFVPELEKQPKQRLHNISDDTLKFLHRPDPRKDALAVAMTTHADSSPIRALRRGDAHGINATHGRRRLPSASEQGKLDADRPSGRAHHPTANRSQIQLSQDIVPQHPVGRRHAEPTPTKASMY